MEAVAQLWNSDEFNPTTGVSSCHEDFATPIDCGFEVTKEFARATPTMVAQRFAKLKLEMTSIITAWEQSGQGDGGVDTTDVLGFGELSGRATGAYDTRSAFLGKYPSYTLYFWEVLDQNDLLSTTVNRLDESVGVTSPNNIPSVLAGDAPRDEADCPPTNDATNFVKGMYTTLQKVTEENNKAAQERQEKQMKHDERQYFRTRLDKLGDEMRGAKRKYRASQDEEDKEDLDEIVAAYKKCEEKLEELGDRIHEQGGRN